jgi:hypothetical protein
MLHGNYNNTIPPTAQGATREIAAKRDGNHTVLLLAGTLISFNTTTASALAMKSRDIPTGRPEV